MRLEILQSKSIFKEIAMCKIAKLLLVGIACLVTCLKVPIANAYEIYEAKSYQCKNGTTLGLVLATQIGIVAQPRPQYYVKYYCDFNTLKGYGKGIESGSLPEPLQKCADESNGWAEQCYKQEFAHKCLQEKFVNLKACFEATIGQDENGASGVQ
jgi:hypothetical protein